MLGHNWSTGVFASKTQTAHKPFATYGSMVWTRPQIPYDANSNGRALVWRLAYVRRCAVSRLLRCQSRGLAFPEAFVRFRFRSWCDQVAHQCAK